MTIGVVPSQHHLGLDPADLAGDGDHLRRGGPRLEPVTGQPEADHGWPVSSPTVPRVSERNSTPDHPAASANSASSSPVR